jgi:hypothetical protein
MVFEDERGRAVEFDSTDCWMSPFSVSKEQFERALLEWLVAGDYTPDDVLKHAMVRDHVGIYAPFYTFTGSYTAEWTANVGFERRETYVDNDRTYKDGEWVDQPVTKTRTVTDWRRISGEAHGDFRIFCLASRQMPGELFEFCEQTPRDVLIAMQVDDALRGFLVEALRVVPETCFRERGQPQLDEIIRKDIRQRMPGDRARNIRWNHRMPDFRSTRVYLPFWLCAYNYQGRRFHFVLDGRDATRFHGGRPVDEERLQRIKELFGPANRWGIVWLVVGIAGVIFFGIPTLLALIVGLPVYLHMTKQANTERDRILEESRAVREQALRAIRGQGGLKLTDDPRRFLPR